VELDTPTLSGGSDDSVSRRAGVWSIHPDEPRDRLRELRNAANRVPGVRPIDVGESEEAQTLGDSAVTGTAGEGSGGDRNPITSRFSRGVEDTGLD
jgi:hypothetical protein